MPLQYENSAFKVPLLDKWVVVVCGPKMCEELRKFRDDELSSFDGIREVRVRLCFSEAARLTLRL